VLFIDQKILDSVHLRSPEGYFCIAIYNLCNDTLMKNKYWLKS